MDSNAGDNMRPLPPAALAALQERNVTLRDFIWFEARTRDTGAQISAGFWSDLGTTSAQVVDPRTGATVSRSFEGAGGLIQISQIPLTSNLTVQSITVSLSQIAEPNSLLRGYDLKQARVEIFRSLYAPATLVQLAPAYARFVGYVDEANVSTPAEGAEGGIELTCMSHSQEMSRYNPATRSDAYMQRRTPGDSFSRHAATVGTWEMEWGNAK